MVISCREGGDPINEQPTHWPLAEACVDELPEAWTFEHSTVLEAHDAQRLDELFAPYDRRPYAGIADIHLSPSGRLLMSEGEPASIHVLSTCDAEQCVAAGAELDLSRIPLRTREVDLDGDGQKEFVVADIGEWATDAEAQGAVLWSSDGVNFETLFDVLGRVTCAEEIQWDLDDQKELVVCVFGVYEPGVFIFDLQADTWVPTPLTLDEGAMNAIVRDFDRDGVEEIAVSISQDSEVVRFFDRVDGELTSRDVFSGGRTDFSMSGVDVADLDRDGDLDLLVSSGDALDFIPDEVDPTWYTVTGIHALMNDGTGEFVSRRLATGSTMNTAIGDLDGDGDLDLAGVSSHFFSPMEDPREGVLFAYEQVSPGCFHPHLLFETELAWFAVEAADFDQDGRDELYLAPMGLYGVPDQRLIRLDLVGS